MLQQDLRYAIRLLARNPGFAAAAVITLALGIGATTAIFSVVNAVLLRPMPFPDADRLVMLWETDRDTGTVHEPGSWPDFVDFGQRSRRLDRVAAFIAGDVNLTPEHGEPQRLSELLVTYGLPALVGVRPLVGRSLTSDDDRVGGPAVALISERLWARIYQRDPGIVGRLIRLDERPRTIIGVVPAGADFGVLQMLSAADYSRGFADRDQRTEVDVWEPLQADPRQLVRDTHPLLMFGRLASGASVQSAQTELATIAADLERSYSSNKARGVFLEPLDHVIFGPSRPALLLLLGAVALVLVIACVNVANLLLARGTARRSEVAVRIALGAQTRQLARQFMTETLLLTTLSALLGVALAVAGLRVLVALAPADVPRLTTAAIDTRVLLVALGITVATALVFGMLPVLHARSIAGQSALNAEDARGASGDRRGRFMRSALVAAEVALALVLVTGAALLIESLWRLQQVDPGFDPAGVLKAEFQLPSTRYPADFKLFPDFREMHRFNDDLLRRLRALPGVDAAAIAGNHPLDPGFTNSFVIVGREAESRDFPELSIRRVTPEYFRTLRVPLRRGRLLAESDATSAPAVALINEAAAQRFFPDQDPIGRQIAFWGARRTIVGVLANEKLHGLAQAAPLATYVPLAQAPSADGGEVVLVRSTGDPAALAGAVQAAVREIDPALAIFGVEPLEQTVAQSLGRQRFLQLLLSLFAALALFLAAVGIHGVLSYQVARRRREIGIRMALGASPRDVMLMVVGRGAVLTVSGLAAGLVLTALLARTLSSVLFGVAPTDATTLAIVVIILSAVAAVSAWLPAHRATAVDPLLALREP